MHAPPFAGDWLGLQIQVLGRGSAWGCPQYHEADVLLLSHSNLVISLELASHNNFYISQKRKCEAEIIRGQYVLWPALRRKPDN